MVSDTDIAVVESAPAAATADGDERSPAADAADPVDTQAPAPVPTQATASSSDKTSTSSAAPAAAPIPPALAALPGETLYYMNGDEQTIMFQTGATPTSGETIYQPHPDVDAIYGTWSIKGNTLTFNGTTYTFDAADGSGMMQFQGPQGELLLTIAAG